MMIRRQTQRCGQHRRSGTATAEFAVCLPLLLVLIFGSIEACTMIFLKQSLTIAAYEGVRVAISSGATNTDAETAANQILTERGVNGGAVTSAPAVISTVPVGQYITITVTAPCNLNSPLRGWFFNNVSLRGQATMMKEF